MSESLVLNRLCFSCVHPTLVDIYSASSGKVADEAQLPFDPIAIGTVVL